MGFIYIISNGVNDKLYVGQTTQTVEQRAKEHFSTARAYQRHLANPQSTSSKTFSALYKAMVEVGIDEFQVDELCEVENARLDELEKYYIRKFNTLIPNGYNSTPGGSGDRSYVGQLPNTDHLRTSEMTKGMPPYVAYARRPQERYYVNGHRLCPVKKSFSVHKYGTIEAAKRACIEFIAKLETGGKPYMNLGPGGLPMKGLRERPHGYQVRKRVRGIVTERHFTDRAKTMEQNLTDAIAYIKSLSIEQRPETKRLSR